MPEGMTMERLEYSLEDLRLPQVTGDAVMLAKDLSSLRQLRVLVVGFDKMDDEFFFF